MGLRLPRLDRAGFRLLPVALRRRLRHRTRLPLWRAEGAESGLLPVLLRRWLRHGVRLSLRRTEGAEARLLAIALLRRTGHLAVCGRHLLTICRGTVLWRMSNASSGRRLLLLNCRPGRWLTVTALRLWHLLPWLRLIHSRLSVAWPAAKRLLLRHPAGLIYLLPCDSGAQSLLRIAIQRTPRIMLQGLLLRGEGNWPRRSRSLHHHLPRYGACGRCNRVSTSTGA